MPAIRIRGIDRQRWGDGKRAIVYGGLQVTARVGSYPAGSFNLSHIEGIVLMASSGVSFATRRGIVGSVRDPEGTYRNGVLLRSIVTGTTGTRNASGPATIGSTLGAGSLASAQFIAWGMI